MCDIQWVELAGTGKPLLFPLLFLGKSELQGNFC